MKRTNTARSAGQLAMLVARCNTANADAANLLCEIFEEKWFEEVACSPEEQDAIRTVVMAKRKAQEALVNAFLTRAKGVSPR